MSWVPVAASTVPIPSVANDRTIGSGGPTGCQEIPSSVVLIIPSIVPANTVSPPSAIMLKHVDSSG